tara:strand:+ start:259 stop:525 length:267 start_codon:yes stop_codon:yes gene_type:complete
MTSVVENVKTTSEEKNVPTEEKNVKEETNVKEEKNVKDINLDDISSVDAVNHLYNYLNTANKQGIFNIQESYNITLLCRKIIVELQKK